MIEEIATTDGVAGQFTLPHTDQSGFQDENGNAYENWYYTATVQYVTDKASLPAKSKVFQLVVGQAVVDLDKLPGGAPAMPYTGPVAGVTSVNGQTGSVLVEGVSDAALEAIVSDPESATATVLSATYGASSAPLKTAFGQRRGNRLALLGDSITDNTTSLSGEGTLWNQASGYFTNANQRLNQRFDLVYQTATDPEFGVSGATTTSILANGDTDQLVAANPDLAFVMAGTNDLTNSAAGADALISGRLVQIFDKIRLAGIPLIVATIPPRLVASDTATVIANHHSVNASIRAYAAQNRGVILCDWYKVISDPATGRANQTYLGDDVHPNIAGASRLGQFLADLLDPLFPKRPVLPNVGDPKNIAPAGAFTAAHSNSTVAVTTVASSDLDPRDWTQLAVSAISSTDASSYARVLKTTAAVTTGEKYQAVVEFQTDAASWNVKGFYLLLKCNGGPLNAVYDGYVVAGASVMNRPASGVFRTPVLTVPAGTTTLQLEVRQYGVGTTRVRADGIMKV
jgi:lysophospholipase L1-like esterase